MRFLRHCGIYRSDGCNQIHFNLGAGTASRWSAPKPSQRTLREELHVLLIVRDEFRPAIPRSGCTPAEPVSASPATRSYDSWQNPGNDLSLNGRCVFPPCLTSGDKLILCAFASWREIIERAAMNENAIAKEIVDAA